MKGKFIVIDGLDGVGKGTGIKAIIEFLEEQGKRILDLDKYWRENNFHPDFLNSEIGGKPNSYFVDLNDYDVICSSEPTYCGIGKTIRDEIIQKNRRKYSARFTAWCYASDRMVLYKRVLLPALEAGKTIVQSRSFSTSITYQLLQAKTQKEDNLSIKEILEIEGNKFVLDYMPDLLIVPTIENVEELISRLNCRSEKNDNCDFENLDFQLQLKPLYEDPEFKNVFESRGTKIIYVNAGVSVEKTELQAVEALKTIL